jgi:hypothetical protein
MSNTTKSVIQRAMMRKYFRLSRDIFLMLMLTASNLFALTGYSLKVHFDLNLSNATLETVFREIEKKSEFSIIYLSKDVDPNERVSINVKNQTVNVILDEVLKGQRLHYEIKDKHIIIYKPALNEGGGANTPQYGNGIANSARQGEGSALPASLAQQTGKRVSGTVKDVYGEPLVGANVIEKGSTNGTATDAAGAFSLTVRDDAAILQINYIGYKSLEISVLDGGG